jgi:hypothetical protein
MHWLHFFSKQKGEVIASNFPDGWTRVTTNVSLEGDGQARKNTTSRLPESFADEAHKD